MQISTTLSETTRRVGSPEGALKLLADAGFDACDFGMWDYPWHGGIWDAPDAEFERHFTSIRNAARAVGIRIGQAHAPFPTTDADPDESARRLRVIRKAIRAAALLDAPAIVIHPALHIDVEQDAGNAKAMEYNLAMYESLVPDLKAAGVQCALENMFGCNAEGKIVRSFFSTAEEMCKALETLGNRHFCICLDIGHIPLVQQQPAKLIQMCGPALKYLHVHDNNGMADQHVIPYAGAIGWDAVCEALRDIGYQGIFNLETDGFLSMLPVEMTKGGLRLTAKIARTLADQIEAD